MDGVWVGRGVGCTGGEGTRRRSINDVGLTLMKGSFLLNQLEAGQGLGGTKGGGGQRI